MNKAKPNYQKVFITHLPAFYKVNLYNAIASKQNIFVIFIGQESVVRTEDFVAGKCMFPYAFVNSNAFENRNILFSLFRLYKILCTFNYDQLIVGGWDLPEFWLAMLSTRVKKNCLALESSVHDCKSTGIKGALKKLFLKRMSLVYASGKPHCKLLDKLSYNGAIQITNGVGLFALQSLVSKKTLEKKFLFVGRLAKEKNIDILIKVFTKLTDHKLTILGSGPLKSKFLNDLPSNIVILNHIPHQNMPQIYSAHDVLILPSFSEAWGLVVEEALFFGLPVIVSDRVGCAYDLVQNYDVGFIFNPNNIETLFLAINNLSNPLIHARLQNNIKNINFTQRNSLQTAAYTKHL